MAKWTIHIKQFIKYLHTIFFMLVMKRKKFHIRHTETLTDQHTCWLYLFKCRDLIGCHIIEQTELFSSWIFLHTISCCSRPPIHGVTIGGSSRSGVKRPYNESTKFSSDTSQHPSFSKAGHSSKHGPLQSSAKTLKNMMKPGTKMTKTASAKAADSVGVFLFSCVKLYIAQMFLECVNSQIFPNAACVCGNN